jgi:hypothetical protein
MGSNGMTKKQDKKLAAARGIADPGARILTYGTGSGHARMSKGLIGLVVGFVAAFAVVLVTIHLVLFPGVILIVVAIGLIRPKRGVALTPDSVLVFHESLWGGKPNRLILSAPISSFQTAGALSTGSTRVTLDFGTERIAMKSNEYERLLRAVVPPVVEFPPA